MCGNGWMLQVYTVQSLVLNCPKSPKTPTHGEDQCSTGSTSPMYSTRFNYKQATVKGQNYETNAGKWHSMVAA
eukprot:scaffold680972_cov59-Prasinocladus_malaysianus.AAC.1